MIQTGFGVLSDAFRIIFNLVLETGELLFSAEFQSLQSLFKDFHVLAYVLSRVVLRVLNRARNR